MSLGTEKVQFSKKETVFRDSPKTVPKDRANVKGSDGY